MGFENNVTIQLTATEEDAVRAWRKTRREGPQGMLRDLEALKNSTKSTDAAMKDMGSKGLGTFKSLAAGVATFVSGVVSAQAVLRGTSAILQRMREDDKKAAAGVTGSAGAMAELAQLANNKKELEALQRRAREMFSSGAATTLDEGARMVFDIESAGVSKDEGLFRDIARYRLASDSGQMALATAQIKTAFGDQIAGSSTKVVSELFGASAPSPSKTTELSGAVAKAAPGAARLGFSPQETMAATSVISKVTGIDEAGTQMASFFRSVMKEAGRFKGKDILETVENVDKSNMSSEQLLDVFGRHEAVNAYLLMSKNKDMIRGLQADTVAAGQESRVQKKIALSAGSPGVSETMGLRAAEAREMEAMEQRGNVVLTADAIQKQASARLKERGYNVNAALYNVGADLVRNLVPGGESEFVRQSTGGMFKAEDLQESPAARSIATTVAAGNAPSVDQLGALMREQIAILLRMEQNTRPERQKQQKIEAGPQVKRERVPNP